MDSDHVHNAGVGTASESDNAETSNEQRRIGRCKHGLGNMIDTQLSFTE